MATKTYTFKSGNFVFTTTTITQTVGSSSTFVLSRPTFKFKHLYSKATRGNIYFDVNASNDYAYAFYGYYRDDSVTKYNTEYTLSCNVYDSGGNQPVSYFFNEDNKSSKTFNINYNNNPIQVEAYSADYVYSYVYMRETDYNLGTLVTLTLDAPPDVTLGTPTYSTPQYAGFGTYSVPITKASAQYGGDITSIKLTVGTQSVTKTYSSATVSSDTISLVPETAGAFTPTITVTDSRGQTTTKPLNEITVNAYEKPTASFDVFRCGTAGIKNDEGHNALITAKFTFTDAVSNLAEPSVYVDGNLLSQVTWYTGLTAAGAVDTTKEIDGENITWADVGKNANVYGLLGSNYSETQSYLIGLQAIDSRDKTSQLITQTLSTAFYTIDFLAGGKEVSFGSPARIDDLYEPIWYPSAPTFESGVYYERSVDATTGVITYTPITTEPSDWGTNWADYYLLAHPKGLFNCEMDMRIGGGQPATTSGLTREFTTWSDANGSQLQIKRRGESSLMLTIRDDGSVRLQSVPNVDGEDDWDNATTIWEGTPDFNEYPHVISQTVESGTSTLAANTYTDKTVTFTRPSACGDESYYPIIAGWNVSGTNSSYVHVLGAYISGSSPNYTLHIKCRNTGSSAVTGMTVTAWVRYIRTN